MRWARIPLLLLLVFISFLAACGRPAKWVYQVTNYQSSFENCKPEPEPEKCTYIKLKYPVFTSGPESKSLPAINRRILDFVITPTGEKKSADIEALANNFFSDFQAFRKEFPKAPQVWSVERVVEVLAETPKLLSLALDETNFMGGAHPNSSRTLVSLNPGTGAPYSLKDLLAGDFQAKLNELGEKVFRAVREIPAGQGLEAAGFDFGGGPFRLNDNFAATPEGLMFFFNSYEIGPYVMGPTEVLIPYTQLKGMMRSRGPLRGLVK